MKIKLKNLGKIYEAEGKTVMEALTKLKIENPKGTGILTMIDGDKERVKILKPFLLQGLSSKVSRMRKEIAISQLNKLF